LLLPGLFDIQPIITVAWSLSYEFFYYLLIPLLVFALGMRGWKSGTRVLFFLTLAALYTFYCMFASRPHTELIMFVSGIALYEAIHTYNVGRRLTPRFDYAALLVLLLSFPLFYILWERPELMPGLSGQRQISAIFSIVVLFFSFFIFTLACFTSRSLLQRMFSWTPLRWLGNMSYSYYLIHGLTLKAIGFVVLRLIAPGTLSTAAFWIGYPIFFFLTLVSSTILFVVVERRFSILPAVSKPAQSVPASSGEEPLASLSSEGKTATVERLAGSI
jgi:peptidoglycan/LPS O-acetylase OafA/YrhL